MITTRSLNNCSGRFHPAEQFPRHIYFFIALRQKPPHLLPYHKPLSPDAQSHDAKLMHFSLPSFNIVILKINVVSLVSFYFFNPMSDLNYRAVLVLLDLRKRLSLQIVDVYKRQVYAYCSNCLTQIRYFSCVWLKFIVPKLYGLWKLSVKIRS